MSIQLNDFHALWRASANEGVPYSEDFSEALLVLFELLDGALGAGEATCIDTIFDLTNPLKCELVVKDNGKGITSESRLKRWASNGCLLGDNHKDNENVYGHGSKKAMTKFSPDYLTAVWDVSWRKQDKRGNSGSLFVMSSPFLGVDTVVVEKDETKYDHICPGQGTEWRIIFNISVLGKYNEPESLLKALKELIRVRYEPVYYHHYQINLKIINGAKTLFGDSSDMKSLKCSLDEAVELGKVVKICEGSITIDRTTAEYSLYVMIGDGRTYNIEGMDIFGRKNMSSTRIHLGRNGRYIEAMPFAKFMGKEQHNSDNGRIGFVMFTGDELPTPCTTKVKFQEECPIFIKMNKNIKIKFNEAIIKHLNPKPIEPTVVVKPEPVKTPTVKQKLVKTEPPTKAPTIKRIDLPDTKVPEPVKSKPSTNTTIKPIEPMVAKPIQTPSTNTTVKPLEPMVAKPIQTSFYNADVTLLQNLHNKYGSELFNLLVKHSIENLNLLN